MLTILITFLSLLFLLMIIGDLFFTIALNAKVKNKEEYKRKQSEELLEQNAKWMENRAEKVSIISKDNLLLKGWILEKEKTNHKWVIGIHCYKGSHLQIVDTAKEFMKIDRNVLIVDLRAHGESNRTFFRNGMAR